MGKCNFPQRLLFSLKYLSKYTHHEVTLLYQHRRHEFYSYWRCIKMAENKGTRILDCLDNIPATSMMFLTFWYKLMMIILWRFLVSSIKEMSKILSKKRLVFFLERLTGPKEKARKNELWSWTRLGKKQRMAPSLKEKGNWPFLVKILKQRPDIPSCLTQPKASIKIWKTIDFKTLATKQLKTMIPEM